ncbi:MAG: translation initiation factor IF-2, partial [Cyanobacteria bacterium REEB65]|nr:translation initiation factor IF-2 [Cyanobacteria bacterium REEB65]
EYEDVFSGKVEIRKIFTFGKSVIGGAYVLEGKVVRNQKAKVLRGKEIVFEGKLDNLKRFKDDVKEVAQGYECGVSFDNFNALQEGDIVEMFSTQVKART